MDCCDGGRPRSTRGLLLFGIALAVLIVAVLIARVSGAGDSSRDEAGRHAQEGTREAGR